MTLLALLVFGERQGTVTEPLRRAWQAAIVVGLAAAAGFAIAKRIA